VVARERRSLSAQPVAEHDADDAALVAASQGDADAFDALYARYADPVLNFCYYRLGRWDEAEDAAQQVFVNVYAALGRFQDCRGSFRAWLFTIAHHEVANRRRHRRRHPILSLDEGDDYRDPDPKPEELAVVADRQDRVRMLLDQLSDDQRRVLELRLAGLTDTEIGGVLGRTPGAVRGVQARGVARLRVLLGLRPSFAEAGHV
jgi:RNA polymerase sigma-70 factor (ECF subfamily)